MSELSLPPVGASWQQWHRFASTLPSADGVHVPSAFSAVLAAALPDLSETRVLDAGSGSGLLTVAAIAHGAEHVIAADMDPAALELTATVAKALNLLTRVSLIECDFRSLGTVTADVTLTNPPQRPARILHAVEPAERHLHEGGGHDGLDAMRLVLEATTASAVYTTGADVLPVSELEVPGWSSATVVDSQAVPMHRAWDLLGSKGVVNVWRFSRS